MNGAAGWRRCSRFLIPATFHSPPFSAASTAFVSASLCSSIFLPPCSISFALNGNSFSNGVRRAVIDQYLAEGIAIHYLFYPRSGPNTESFFKAEQVWCSADRRQDPIAFQPPYQHPSS